MVRSVFVEAVARKEEPEQKLVLRVALAEFHQMEDHAVKFSVSRRHQHEIVKFPFLKLSYLFCLNLGLLDLIFGAVYLVIGGLNALNFVCLERELVVAQELAHVYDVILGQGQVGPQILIFVHLSDSVVAITQHQNASPSIFNKDSFTMFFLLGLLPHLNCFNK